MEGPAYKSKWGNNGGKRLNLTLKAANRSAALLINIGKEQAVKGQDYTIDYLDKSSFCAVTHQHTHMHSFRHNSTPSSHVHPIIYCQR